MYILGREILTLYFKVLDAVVGSEYCIFSIHMLAVHCETWLLISGHVHNDILESHGLCIRTTHYFNFFGCLKKQVVVMIDVPRDMAVAYLFVQKKSVKKTREALTRILKNMNLMFVTIGNDHRQHCEYICYHDL